MEKGHCGSRHSATTANAYAIHIVQLKDDLVGEEPLEAALLRLDKAYADTNMIKICEDNARQSVFGPVAADPETHTQSATTEHVNAGTWYNVHGWAESLCFCYAAQTVCSYLSTYLNVPITL